MDDRRPADPAEQPRCARCNSGGILDCVHLYAPPGQATRHVWLCAECGSWFGMTTPWPGMITAADYDRATPPRTPHRGRRRREEKFPDFPALYDLIRRTLYTRLERTPLRNEIIVALSPAMGWDDIDDTTFDRYLERFNIPLPPRR